MKEDRILSHNIGEAESLFLYLDSWSVWDISVNREKESRIPFVEFVR